MDMLKLYVVNRAKEASTWRGVVMLLTAVGLKITPRNGGRYYWYCSRRSGGHITTGF